MATPAPPATPPAKTVTTLTLTQVLLSAFGLALVLAVAFGVPLLATCLVMGMVIYAGWKASWNAVQLGIRIAIGVAIFVTLRFLIGKLLGLYPADTFDTLNNSGGLYWILVGHDVSTRILLEVTFAFVAGQVTLNWVLGTSSLAKKFIVAGFLVLCFVIGVPKYVNTWASRDEVSTTLENEGVLGAGWKGVKVFLFGKPAPTSPPPPAGAQYRPTPPVPTTPNIIRGVTPAELSVDFEFNIEADGPIRITYADGQTMVFEPGKGCQQFPTPRYSGKKKFLHPTDPAGQVAFRIYRLKPGEGTCKK